MVGTYLIPTVGDVRMVNFVFQATNKEVDRQIDNYFNFVSFFDYYDAQDQYSKIYLHSPVSKYYRKKLKT